MKTIDELGAIVERQLDDVERRFGQYAFGPLVLGAILAVGVIAGGMATFIAVLVVLVRLFS